MSPLPPALPGRTGEGPEHVLRSISVVPRGVVRNPKVQNLTSNLPEHQQTGSAGPGQACSVRTPEDLGSPGGPGDSKGAREGPLTVP